MYESIPNNLNRLQKVWIFQHRYDENSPWVPMYCFVDLEFTPEDIHSMNFQPWLDKTTIFTQKAVAVRFTTEKEVESEGGPGSPDEDALGREIDGSMTLDHNVLKWRRHGKKAVELSLKTEQERVTALQKYFGIILSDEDREAIINTAAMIGARTSVVND